MSPPSKRAAASPEPTVEEWHRRIDQLAATDATAALEACDRAIQAYPTHGPLCVLSADLLAREGRFDEAERRLDRALELSPDDAKTMARLARINVQQSRWLDAIRLYETALAADPTRTTLHEELGRLHLMLCDHLSATRHAGLALAHSHSPAGLMLMETALDRLTRDAEAGIAPSVRRDALLALDHLRCGRPADAEAQFARITRRSPRLALAWVGLRDALDAQGRTSEGEAALSAGGATGPANARIMRAAARRRLSPRGRLIDPDEPLPVRQKEDVLARVSTGADLRETGNAYLVIDAGGETVRRRPFIGLEDDRRDGIEVTYETVESFMLRLDHAAVAGKGVVLTDRNEVIEGTFLDFLSVHQVEVDGDRMRINPGYPDADCPVAWFDGPALLMTGPGDTSFGDWIMTFPPRLWLAEAAGLDLPLLVSRHIRPQFIDMLGALGVDRDRLLFHDPDGISMVETLYVPSWPAPYRSRPMKSWMRIYERAQLKADTGRRPLLYLSRENCTKRGLVNEPEIRELFASRGFEVICPETMSFAEVLKTFARPACVAGPYGSALRNVVFSRDKPVCLVLMPPYGDQEIRGTAIGLAEAGVTFGYVRGETAPGVDLDAVPFSHLGAAHRAGWTIDIDRVERALDAVPERIGRNQPA